MLEIFAKSFNIATRTEQRNHWQKHNRFDDRRAASFFPHNPQSRTRD